MEIMVDGCLGSRPFNIEIMKEQNQNFGVT